MICKRCGAQNSENSKFCGGCGNDLRDQGSTASTNANANNTYANISNKPTNFINATAYLVWAIITLVFCLPLGIPAIVFAVRIDKNIAMGEMFEANDNARKSKLFSITGLAVTVGLFIIEILIIIMGISSYGKFY